MTNLRATVIMKTDMCASTARLRQLPESDMGVVFTEHQSLIARVGSTHGGQIVKSEGDGFWLVFPSATAAALAAVAMRDDLRLAQPNRGDDRLAMHDRPHDSAAKEPADDEYGAVHPGTRGDEHEDDRDDRKGRQRNADPERQ